MELKLLDRNSRSSRSKSSSQTGAPDSFAKRIHTILILLNRGTVLCRMKQTLDISPLHKFMDWKTCRQVRLWAKTDVCELEVELEYNLRTG
jgi:hypothetical protein